MSALVDIQARFVALADARTPPDWYLKLRAAERPQPTNRRRVIGLSGGKDSTALTIALMLHEPASYETAITPTGDELPAMVSHWAMLEALLGQPLTVVGVRTLQGLIFEQRAIPNHRQRWCTRMLEPYYAWLGEQGPVVSYIGLRADEESRPGMLFPEVGQVEMDFPMRRWGWVLADVLDFLAWCGVTVPDRTDCALCFWQTLAEWYFLWVDHRDRFERGVLLEDFVTAARGSPFTFRSPGRDAWPASLRELGEVFAAGRIPARSIMMAERKRQIGACRACTL